MTSVAEKTETGAILRRFYDEVFNQGKVEAVSDLVTDDFVDHIPHPLPVQPSTGRDAVSWSVAHFRGVFPDLHVTVDDVFGIGDRLAARTTWRGTHRGRFLGVSPTGRPICVTGLDIVRIVDDKIAEHWGQLDVLDLMLQVGFLPQADETTA